jgi:hypothetical protein
MKRRRKGEEELEKERKKGTHFEKEEAYKERAHLLGDEGALVLEVEGVGLQRKKGALFKDKGHIASWRKGSLNPEKERVLQGTAGTCFMANWAAN